MFRTTSAQPARPLSALVPLIAIMALMTIILTTAGGTAWAQTNPPATPENPEASLVIPEEGKYRVRIAWDNPHDNGITGYTITRSDGQTFESNGQPTTYTDDSTEPGRSYRYTVTAKSAAGDSPASRTPMVILPEAPTAVTGLHASIGPAEAVHTSVQVTLTWNPPPEPQAQACEDSYPVTEYRISRSAGGGTPVEIAVTPAGASLSHVDETADFNTAYTYQVEAVSRIRNGAASTTAVDTPKRPIPPPTGLDVDETATPDPFDGTVTIDWTSPQEGPAITGYRITRQDSGARPQELVENTRSTDTAHTDSGLSAGETYIYIVSALSTDNASPESEPLSVWAPMPVLNPAAQAENDHIDVSWTAPEETRYLGYIVRRQEAGGTGWTLLDVVESPHYADGPEPSGMFASPPAHDTPYVYSVQSRNELGIGGAWAESGTVILMTRPGAPDGVTAEVSNNNIEISWTRPAGKYLDGYRISRMTPAPDALTQGEWTTIQDSLAADITSHTDTDAALTLRYGYRVQAYNPAGDGPWSETATVTPITPPATPDDLTARAAGNDIAVSWTRPDSVNLNAYELSIARDDQPGQDPTVENIAASETQYRVADAPADVTFSFRLRAHNIAGQSPWTQTARATRIAVPAAPTALTAETGETDIVVSWQPSSSRFVDGYHVAYGVAGSEQRHTTNLEPSATSFTHSDNAEGETYEYRVRAHNPTGHGPWSDPVTARRLNLPQLPTGVEASVSGDDIVVSWTAPATGVTDSYQIRSGRSGSEETTTSETEATSFTHEGTAGDTRYHYQVRSKNDAGESAWTEAVTAMRLLPPNPPTGVKTSKADRDIVLAWTAPSASIVGEYQVEYRQTLTQDWDRKAVGGADTSWTHKDPTPGTTYEYRLRTANAAGVSGWTDPVQETWYRGAAPPRPFLALNMGNSRIMVLWHRSTTPETTGYEFRQNIEGGDWTTTGAGNRNHTIVEWNDGESYREYAVRGLIDSQKGDWTATHRLSLTRPSGVKNLTVHLEGRNKIRVKWDHPDTGEPAKYQVTHTRDGAKSISSITQPSHRTTTVIEGWGDQASYAITVRAYSHSGLVDQAGSTATVTVRTEPEEQVWAHLPSGLDTQPVDQTTVRLTWNAPTQWTSNISGYRIYRKEVSDSTPVGDDFSQVVVSSTRSEATTYVDHRARPGARYQYGIAVRRDGTSTPVEAVSTRAYGSGQ